MLYVYMCVDISDCIQDMKSEYSAGCGLPITDDSQSLQRFCLKLEHLLQTGLRGLTLWCFSIHCLVAWYNCRSVDVCSLGPGHWL